MPVQSWDEMVKTAGGPSTQLTDTEISPSYPKTDSLDLQTRMNALATGFTDTNVFTGVFRVLNSGTPWDKAEEQIKAYRNTFGVEPGYNPAQDPRYADPRNASYRYILAQAQSRVEMTAALEALEPWKERIETVKRGGAAGTIGELGGYLAAPSALLPLRMLGTARGLALTAGVLAVEEAGSAAARGDTGAEQFAFGLALGTGGASGLYKWFKAGKGTAPFAEHMASKIDKELTDAERILQEELPLAGGGGGKTPPPPGGEGRGSPWLFGEPYAKEPRPGPWSLEPATVLGFDLANIADSPLKRVLQYGVDEAKDIASRLVESPWFHRANMEGIPSPFGVDREAAYRWITPSLLATRTAREFYSDYVKRLADEAVDATVPAPRLSQQDFMNEVGRAKLRLHGGDLTGFPEEVIAAAKHYDEVLYAPAARDIAELQIRSHAVRRELARAEENLAQAEQRLAGQATDPNPDLDRMKLKVQELKETVRKIESAPIDPNYRNRVYDRAKIKENETAFKADLIRLGVDPKAVGELTRKLLKENPRSVSGLQDVRGKPYRVGLSASLRDRGDVLGDIPDTALENWLVNDIEQLARLYASRTGMDIELFRKFGSADLEEQFAKVRASYDARIQAAKPGEVKALQTEYNGVMEDLQSLLERARGIYRLPEDPLAWNHKVYRGVKQFALMTTLTGFLAQIPDAARLIMEEGFMRVGRDAVSLLTSDRSIYKMAKVEMNEIGEGLDFIAAMRAGAMTDVGVPISPHGLEWMMEDATQKFFNISGMNAWNVGAKLFTTLVVGSRILRMGEKLAKGTALTRAETARLARAGLSEADTRALHDAWQASGAERKGSLRLANTTEWKDVDPSLIDRFRKAVAKDISIIVTQAGRGDTPNALEDPLASVLFQYKKFAFTLFNRGMVAPMQLKERAMWEGIVVAVGLGLLIDQIRWAQLVPGPDRRSTRDKLQSAISRGGVLGPYMDAWQTVERFMELPSPETPHKASERFLKAVQTLTGPAGAQAVYGGRALWDIASGSATSRDAAYLRRMMLGNRLAHLDFMFDMAEGGMKSVLRPSRNTQASSPNTPSSRKEALRAKMNEKRDLWGKPHVTDDELDSYFDRLTRQ